MSVHLRCDICTREFSWEEKGNRWLALVPVTPWPHSIFSVVDQTNHHGTVCSGGCALEWLCKQGGIERAEEIGYWMPMYYPVTRPPRVPQVEQEGM